MGKCPTTCPECGAQLGGAGKKNPKGTGRHAVVPDNSPDIAEDMPPVVKKRRVHKKSATRRNVGPDLGTNPIYGNLRWT
jgi:hypothetical protein